MSVDEISKSTFPSQFSSEDSTSYGDGTRNVHSKNDIAICGMAMRLPGGITSGDEFWDFLVNKKDARTRVPTDRYNSEAFYGAVNTEYGYFLQDTDLACFDSSFFSLTKSELERLDPQHRLLLEVTRECLENAGEMNWRGKEIGCYIGTFGEDWLDLHAKDTQDSSMYRMTGYGDFFLANRISYEYDFRGPSITMKTACSSSLVCLHMACEALKTGQITSAIVGGSNLIISPTMTIVMTEQGVMSPDGSCKTFDANADGYARGEAINTIYVKRLDDALRDGNPIHAVIRSTAINSDGKTPGITHPRPESHEALIREAYQVAGIHDYSKTAFVECHGTGTATGDPLEATAIANVFGEAGVYIGSVKPNIGHSEGASGLTSVIKSVLALQKKTIPPNIKFNQPNPKIPFERGLQVPVDSIPWPESRGERVSVNSFGIGGQNAHVILDSADSFGLKKAKAVKDTCSLSTPRLLVFTANRIESVRRGSSNYQEYIKKNPGSLEDIAYSLGVRREHLPYRSFAVCNENEDFEFSVPSKTPAVTPEINLVFTGQGAQWAEMGMKLISEFPSALKDIQLMDEVLSELDDPPTWTIREELCKERDSSRINQAEFSQPLCTAVQIVIVNLLHIWGVVPSAVVGHSSGEVAAAYACGALTLKEAIITAYFRGYVTKQHKRLGAMAALGLGSEAVSPYLVDGITIACENSPASTTLSGDIDQINSVVAKIKTDHPDVLARLLKVEMAYHSHHMIEIGEAIELLLGPHIVSSAPKIPFFSSVTNTIITKARALDAAYWRQNAESPVLFHTAICKLLETTQTSNRIFVEIGPHSTLAGPIRQILKATQSDASYIPTLIRNHDDAISLLTAAGQIFMKGGVLDFNALNSSGALLTNLPNYPWHHDTKYWYESRISREWRLRKFPRHDILGSRVAESSDLEMLWRNMLRLDEVPWCRDHVISQDIVFPGAGYIAMAGEAIRQVTGVNDYSLRNLSISGAMILHESSVTETLFTMRPLRLTMSLDSEWYEFSVQSHNGTAWTKHCAGQVSPGIKSNVDPRAISRLPRILQPQRWYRAMREVGLNYGPRFQGLEEISTHPIDNLAVARVSNTSVDHESPDSLHPTTMDCCIQLFCAAVSNGHSRRLGKMYVPTYFGEICVKASTSNLVVEVVAERSAKGAINGDCLGTAGDEVVLQMKDVKLSPLDGNDLAVDEDPHAGVRIQWKPDIDFLETRDLIRATKPVRDSYPTVQKLVLLCAIEAHERLSTINTSFDHLRKYSDWLNGQITHSISGSYEGVDKPQLLLQLSSVERLDLISETAMKLQKPEAANIGIAIYRIFKEIENIFRGDVSPLELLLQDDVLANLYHFVDGWEYERFLDLLSHEKPHLRILEIGAGTGKTTEMILRSLVSDFGERMFYSYTYTDISNGCLATAKERFKNTQGIEFLRLDISQDPLQQGLEPGSFDLVIAPDVLHTTSNVGETLKNILKLLSPKGKFLLQELRPTTNWINFIMGVLPGWWLGVDDGRIDEPNVTTERWIQELSLAGFDGAKAVVYADEIPHHMNTTMICSPKTPELSSKQISILSEYPESLFANRIFKAFQERGFSVNFIGLSDKPIQDQDIISILDMEGKPFLAEISSENYDLLKSFIAKLTSSGILWLTKSCQLLCSEPQYAQIIGLARSLRNELSVDIATFELDHINHENLMDSVIKVATKFQLRSKDGDVHSDYEFALSNGVVNIPRFHWISVADELAAELAPKSEKEAPKHLEIGKRGFLNSLRWVERPQITLVDDEISVEIRAVGMNFKDVLIAMGIVDGTKEEGNGLGCECAGVVREVGPDADVEIGDRVVVFAGNSYATILRTTSSLCAKIPDDLSFEDGATMPCVYSTVIHGLLDLARLEKGQTCLIHSACGGIGLAALQMCRFIGAEIFVSVGTDDKVKYLMDTFGIPKNRIFNSRNSSFLQGVMRETNGEGVDVVLNSLSGDLLHTSWKCVAAYGKMIEIGKRDFIGQGRLSMEIFEANRSFFGVDLARICSERPSMIKKLLETCMSLYRNGAIQPIHPIKYFDAVDIEDAFRFMQKGQHIGKIVVRLPHNHSELRASNTHQKFSLKSNVSYLLVGGLGGLGQSISTWMADHGARNLVYLSRNGLKGLNDTALVKELKAYNCNVQIIRGSVANLDDVKRAIREAKMPIAGVIQMSMVLKDGGFPQMTHEDWEAAVSPKVRGTWNLHKAFQSQKLDFFLLFSSFSGLVGQWGQANYSSANTFLDAFVQYRHKKGLAASVLDIGAMDDIGYLSQNSTVMEQFRATAAHILREQDLLDAVELSILKSAPPSTTNFDENNQEYLNKSQLGIGFRMTQPISAPNNRSIWKHDIRMALYRNLETTSTVELTTGSNDSLKNFMTAVGNNPQLIMEESSVALLAEEIGQTLYGFMMRPIDDGMDMTGTIGMDSLVAIELRNWCRQRLGLQVSVLEIMGAASINKLGRLAAEGLRIKLGVNM